MSDYCKECKENTVAVVKYGLCMKCYAKARRYGRLPGAVITDCKTTQIKSGHDREIQFIKNFFVHPNWIHHPGLFRTGMFSYSPDFYDGERNVFIEVAGTRQAYHANKDKIRQIQNLFPLIKFEVRQVSGTLIDPSTDERLAWDGEIIESIS